MDASKKHDKPSPYAKANFFSKMVFWWLKDLLLIGYRRDLQVEDLYNTLPQDDSTRLGDRLEQKWSKEAAQKRPNLRRAILQTFWVNALDYSIFYLMYSCLFRVGQALFLCFLIDSFRQESPDNSTRIWYAVGLLSCSLGCAVCYTHFICKGNQSGMRIRVALCSLMYRKVLRQSRSRTIDSTPIQVANLLANDATRFDEAPVKLSGLYTPLQVIIVTVCAWSLMGISAVIGVLILILLTAPLQILFGHLSAVLRLKVAEKTDKRVQLLGEIIAGIKLIKMYAWETPFFKMVHAIRKSEMRSVLHANYVRGNVLSSLLISDRIALVFTLLPYVLLGNDITAAKVYAVAEMYNAMKLGLAYYLPLALTTMGECKVSIDRIQKFLLQEERVSTKQENDYQERGAVMLDDVSTGWVPHVDALSNVSMDIKPGTLCAVVGQTGTGKSSLLQTLLGELPLRRGSMNVNGSVSFCCQEPWLFSATIRRNILFGLEFDEQRYNEVLRVCALERDIRYLPQGDGTLVGEKGAVLSGGQKARINLARAVYRKADIYLLDNPLAAVDNQVAQHILNECICGFLKDTTRILVVHQPQYVKQADLIIALNKGCIDGIGTYQEIQSKTEALHQILDTTDELVSEEKEDIHAEKFENIEKEVETSRDDKEESETAELLARGRVDKKVYSKYFLAGSSVFRVAMMVTVFVIGQGLVCSTDWWTAYWTNQEDLRRTLMTPVTSTPPPLPPHLNISQEISHQHIPRKNISASEKILRALEILDTLDMKYVLNNMKHISHDADHPLPPSLQGWNATTSTDTPTIASISDNVPIEIDLKTVDHGDNLSITSVRGWNISTSIPAIVNITNVSSEIPTETDFKDGGHGAVHLLSTSVQVWNNSLITPAVVNISNASVLRTEAGLEHPQGNTQILEKSVNELNSKQPNHRFTTDKEIISSALQTDTPIQVLHPLNTKNQTESGTESIEKSTITDSSLTTSRVNEPKDVTDKINPIKEHEAFVSDYISMVHTSLIQNTTETDQNRTQTSQHPTNGTHIVRKRETTDNVTQIQDLTKLELDKIQERFVAYVQNKQSEALTNSTTQTIAENITVEGTPNNKVEETTRLVSASELSSNAALLPTEKRNSSVLIEDSEMPDVMKLSSDFTLVRNATQKIPISSSTIKSLITESKSVMSRENLIESSDKALEVLNISSNLSPANNTKDITHNTSFSHLLSSQNITQPLASLIESASNNISRILSGDFDIPLDIAPDFSVNKSKPNGSSTTNSIDGLLMKDFSLSSATTPKLDPGTNNSINQLKSPVGSVHNSTILIDKRYPYFNATRRVQSVEDAEEQMTSKQFLWIYASFVGMTLLVVVWRTNFYMEVLARSSKGLHKKMLLSVLNSPMKFFDANPSGRIMNRFTKDLGIIDEAIPFTMLLAIQNVTVAIGIVIVVATQNSWTLIPFVFAGGIFWKMSQLYLATADDVRRLEGITRSPIFSHLSATIDGLATIRASGMSHLLRQEFDSLQNQHTAAWTLTISTGMFLNLWADLTCTFFMACIIILFLVVADDMPSGTVGLALSQTLVLLGMTSMGITLSTIVANMMVSVERLVQYTELEPEPGSEPGSGRKPPTDWPALGELQMENLDMSYSQAGPLILKDININIRPGEKIGVVGRTGAGKSSLAVALFRMGYWRGSIKIDGEDISRLSLKELRENISIIPQNPVLFSAPIRVNLDPTGTIPDVELWEALTQVELKDAVSSLDMTLNEAGSNLSVGQKQLLCLARVILRKNKILVLDEATANVDPRTDALIQQSIRQQFGNYTGISIAHRLNNIMDADRVLVLDEGHIVEFDHPHVLLQNSNGFLSKLLLNMDQSTAESLKHVAAESYKILES